MNSMALLSNSTCATGSASGSGRCSQLRRYAPIVMVEGKVAAGQALNRGVLTRLLGRRCCGAHRRRSNHTSAKPPARIASAPEVYLEAAQMPLHLPRRGTRPTCAVRDAGAVKPSSAQNPVIKSLQIWLDGGYIGGADQLSRRLHCVVRPTPKARPQFDVAGHVLGARGVAQRLVIDLTILWRARPPERPLNIFLSYASDCRRIADDMYLPAAGDAGQVFFDCEDPARRRELRRPHPRGHRRLRAVHLSGLAAAVADGTTPAPVEMIVSRKMADAGLACAAGIAPTRSTPSRPICARSR